MKKDPFVAGVLAAGLANTIVNGLDFFVYRMQLTEHPIWHLAASVYLPTTEAKTLIGRLIGVVTDYGVATGVGLILVYILYRTGTDHFYLKGMIGGFFSWLFIFGVIVRSGLVRLEPIDPATNLFHMFNHLLLGGLLGWLAHRFLPDY